MRVLSLSIIHLFLLLHHLISIRTRDVIFFDLMTRPTVALSTIFVRRTWLPANVWSQLSHLIIPEALRHSFLGNTSAQSSGDIPSALQFPFAYPAQTLQARIEHGIFKTVYQIKTQLE